MYWYFYSFYCKFVHNKEQNLLNIWFVAEDIWKNFPHNKKISYFHASFVYYLLKYILDFNPQFHRMIVLKVKTAFFIIRFSLFSGKNSRDILNVMKILFWQKSVLNLRSIRITNAANQKLLVEIYLFWRIINLWLLCFRLHTCIK